MCGFARTRDNVSSTLRWALLVRSNLTARSKEVLGLETGAPIFHDVGRLMASASAHICCTYPQNRTRRLGKAGTTLHAISWAGHLRKTQVIRMVCAEKNWQCCTTCTLPPATHELSTVSRYTLKNIAKRAPLDNKSRSHDSDPSGDRLRISLSDST